MAAGYSTKYRINVFAIDRCLAIIARRSRLLGLDAPARLEVKDTIGENQAARETLKEKLLALKPPPAMRQALPAGREPPHARRSRPPRSRLAYDPPLLAELVLALILLPELVSINDHCPITFTTKSHLLKLENLVVFFVRMTQW